MVPSYHTGKEGEDEALDVLAHLLGGGPASLLFKSLVIDEKFAVNAGAHYAGTALDATRFYLYAIPAAGISLEKLGDEIDRVVARLVKTGVDPADLARSKTRLVA